MWNKNSSLPIEKFVVNIVSDEIPEPVEVFNVVLECEINCFLPQEVYSVTIVDDLGE